MIVEDGGSYVISELLKDSKCQCGLQIKWEEGQYGFEATCECGREFLMNIKVATVDVFEPNELGG